MKKTVNLNFDIYLSKSIDTVCLRILDRDTFNVYQIIFNKIFVIQNGFGNINNVHTILNESLDKLTCSPNTILVVNDVIELHVEYNKNDFVFSLTCELNKISSSEIDGKDLYIQKLEQKIDQLEQSQMYVFWWRNCTFVIPKKLKKIIFKPGDCFEYNKYLKQLIIHRDGYSNMVNNNHACEIYADEIEIHDASKNYVSFFTQFPWLKDNKNITFV